MATSVQHSAWLSDTDEGLRDWGKAISDGIRAVGLIQTEDAGQIDWETVEAAASSGTAAGYEIWRFDDALQDTHPVFLKLEYGSRDNGSSYNQGPGMWVTVGRSTDGAGTVTGVLAPRRAWADSAGNASAIGANQTHVEPTYVSSDGSSLCIAPRIRGNNAPSNAWRVGAIIVDRSRDHSGNPTAVGGVVLTEGRGVVGSVPNWGTPASSVAPAEMHAWTYAGDFTMGDAPAIFPNYVNSTSLNVEDVSLANGDRAPIFPYIVTVPGHEPWQVLAAVAVAAGDAANGPFTATTLGRLRNYRSIPVTDSHNRWATGRRGGYTGLCILWED